MSVGVATASETPPRRGFAALFPVREVVVPWFVSRLYSALLIIGARTVGGPGGPRFSGFTKWDGQWYLVIAAHGYGVLPHGHVQTRWPFFPLLPGVIRAISDLGLPNRTGAVVFNHLVFLLALAGVWRIACRHTAPRPARLAVWALALFPGAFVFSMVYPSSIFLGASVWAFVLVEERRDLLAAVPVAAAALVRPNGIAVALALVLALRSWRRVAIVCGPAVLALAAWLGFLQHRAHDPLIFLSAKSGWPEVTILAFLREPYRYDYVFPHLALGAAAVVAVVLWRRRLPAPWVLFTALYLVPSLGLGMVGFGRYTNECFPPFVAAGNLLDRARPWLRRAAFTTAVSGQALCAWWVIHQNYIP
jgi:hypothetical protein